METNKASNKSFKVPTDYFKSLQENLKEIPSKEKLNTPKKSSKTFYLISSLAVAATLLIAFLIFNSEPELDITEDEILISYLIEQDEYNNIIDLAVEIETESYLSENEIYEYLLNEDELNDEDLYNEIY